MIYDMRSFAVMKQLGSNALHYISHWMHVTIRIPYITQAEAREYIIQINFRIYRHLRLQPNLVEGIAPTSIEWRPCTPRKSPNFYINMLVSYPTVPPTFYLTRKMFKMLGANHQRDVPTRDKRQPTQPKTSTGYRSTSFQEQRENVRRNKPKHVLESKP